MKNSEFGKWAEDLALSRLTAKGYVLVERNVHFREGEIDMILSRSDVLYFVEVKARRNSVFGAVVETLTTQKIMKLKKAVLRWKMRSGDSRFGKILFVGIFLNRGVARIQYEFVE